MNFVILGLNHKTSNIGIREQFYLSTQERELLLTELRNDPRVYESIVISTCNRTEIYALISGQDDFIFERLCMIKKVTPDHELRSHFYDLSGREAAQHLFCVAAGLDSLVLGEKEILGQVKDAVAMSRDKQMLGRFCNILTNIVIHTAKKARHETKIGSGGSSVSWAAVEMANQIFGSLEGKSILIVGAGKMSHLAAGDFRRKGIENLYIMNRTKERGDALARKFKGESVGFWNIRPILEEVDVCICSISAPHYVIEHELVSNVMKNRENRLVLIDISMPRNIHPEVAGIENTLLVGLDELDRTVRYNTQQRQAAAREVLSMIDGQLERFYRKITDHEALKPALTI